MYMMEVDVRSVGDAVFLGSAIEVFRAIDLAIDVLNAPQCTTRGHQH
jgi:hypothetical protein